MYNHVHTTIVLYQCIYGRKVPTFNTCLAYCHFICQLFSSTYMPTKCFIDTYL